ncbi:MAG: pyridoxamine 5'-phosphate oxidase family protein [Rhodospirillales bacterium]|nr:pyridoxamine 5'-phosphate oxidase family protein [Rhodospirillales bacterium]
MADRFAEIAFTPLVRAAQERHGSRAAYARLEGGPPNHDRLGEREAAFIAARDSFYIASVSETGWPQLQHRGGPPGFIRILGERLIGFADFRGNRQYVTVGNIAANDRVALFFMDYPNRARLKLLGRARAVDPAAEPRTMAALALPDYPARVERGILIAVEAFAWNCSQHITPRWTEAEVARAVAPLRERLAALEAENAALAARLRAAGLGDDRIERDGLRAAGAP